jgi:hypothetical protein
VKLKQYCVTVMDNWTPTREFWTYKGALAFREAHLASAYLHQWFGGKWVEIMRPPNCPKCGSNQIYGREGEKCCLACGAHQATSPTLSSQQSGGGQ